MTITENSPKTKFTTPRLMKAAAFVAALVLISILVSQCVWRHPDSELWHAVETNDVQLAKQAIADGADVGYASVRTESTDELQTLAHLASQKGHTEMLGILVAGGADINAIDTDGRSVLMRRIVAEDNNLECLSFLLKHGADVNYQDRNGSSALHLAARFASPEVLSALIAAGAKVNVMNRAGFTPLHSAVTRRQGTKEDVIILTLLKAGADSNAKNKPGATSADLARDRGRDDLASLIEGVPK